MLCDRCKKEEACFHIRGIDQDGNVRSLNLCARCAMAELTRNGGEVDDHFLDAVRQAAQNLGPEIMDVLQKNILKLVDSDDKNRKCGSCGKLRQEFQEDCSLGCRECMHAFFKQIQYYLDNQFDYATIQCGEKGGFHLSDHIREHSLYVIEENIQQLRREMDLAVRREEYEHAAQIQERIKVCQDRLFSGMASDHAAGQVQDGQTPRVDEYSDGFYENHRLPWLPRSRQEEPVVVLSSFVTAERNLDQLELPPFVNHFQDAQEVTEQLLTALGTERLMGKMHFYNPDEMERDGLTGLHEHGWCRPEFLVRAHPRGIVVSENERIICLLNDRNHLQMTFWGDPGQFPDMLPAVQQMITSLSAKVTFWKNSSGYITRDVRFIGTGIRMGGVIHLPALMIAKYIRQVTNACKTLGVVLRPCFSEKQDKDGLFVFYNASSKNASLEDIALQVRHVQNLLVHHELECRRMIQNSGDLRLKLCDLVGRAWGIISEARLLSPAEGRSLLSLIWLGMDYGMLPSLTFEKVMQGLCDLLFYDMGVIKKKLLPEGVSTDKILAARFRHDIAGNEAGE